MPTKPSQQRSSPFLGILFEGTTSHNGRDEILAAFDQVEDWPKAPQVCAYYQGCGYDLITLACRTVDTHVLSDFSSHVVDELGRKFRRLSDSGFITGLQGDGRQWRFSLDGRRKDVHFTEEALEHLDFSRRFGRRLGVVFEWNCGDSASKESFWRALSRQMVAGGHVIGSYSPGFHWADRSAFVLNTSGKKPMLQGHNGFDDVASDERMAVLARATELGLVPNTPPGKQVLEVGSHAYMLDWAGGNHTAVTRVWRQAVETFDLQLIAAGNRICWLTRCPRATK